MTRTNYFLTVVAVCLLLPLAAVAPYAFYGKGIRVLRWIWETGYWPFWLNLGVSSLAAFVSGILLLQYSALGRVVYSLSAVLVTAGSALFAMSEHRHSLLVLVFAFAVILVWTGEWLRRTLELPFYDSKRSWWESHPKAIPGVKAEVFDKKGGEQTREVRVVNLGEQGCFVFLVQGVWDFSPHYIQFHLGSDAGLGTKVAPVIFTRDRTGVGLRFERYQHQDDWNRDLEQCLNGLRRAGYVSG